MKKLQWVAVFVCGISVGLIFANVLTLSQPAPVYANGSSGVGNGIVAVTGLVSNNYSGLWVVDTNESPTSPSVALYIPRPGGKGMMLSGARRIKWDLQLYQYEDRTNKKYRPAVLRRTLDEINEKAEGK